jgi:hypothetical protein
MLASSTAAATTVTLTTALGPAFAAGFALQRLLDLLDPVLSWPFPPKDTHGEPTRAGQVKKLVLSIVSLVMGIVIARTCGLHVIQALEGLDAAVPWDVFLTGLIISGGTEGVNSIVKFVGYAKDAKKGEAAQQLTAAPARGLSAVNG